MRAMLDTCAWLFWQQDPAQLTFHAADLIAQSLGSGGVVISAASVWEIAVKSAKGRLPLGEPVESWVPKAAPTESVTLLDLTPDDLMASCSLPPWDHKDPFDRIIAATARRLQIPLVTSDRVLRAWDHVHTVW